MGGDGDITGRRERGFVVAEERIHVTVRDWKSQHVEHVLSMSGSQISAYELDDMVVAS